MAVVVPVASGGTASVGPAPFFSGLDAVLFVADAGETNDVVITSSSAFQITDAGAVITAGAGCVAVDAHTARCASSLDELLVVELGDQDDTLTLTSAFGNRGAYFGGGGDDVIRGGELFTEDLFGDSGDDVLKGRGEEDILHGGPGADVLRGGTSGFTHAAAFNPHRDIVTYEDSVNPVTVVPNGLADDGEVGEGDNVFGDVELVIGGDAGDRLRAGGHMRELSGGPGDDVLLGGRRGQSLAGGPGGDIMRGGSGRDFLNGGPGSDRLAGGLGRDELLGQEGADLLLARDGHRDIVRGAGGHDRARVDAIDDVHGIESLIPRRLGRAALR